MIGRAGSRGGWAACLCGMLVCLVAMTLATDVAAWHLYHLLLTLPPQESDASDNARVVAGMWLGNLAGWWQATVVATGLLCVLWLWDMRELANRLWPQGQRRHTAWALFGWLLPVAQLFVPKMFVNDLWSAAQPPARRRRGSPLLTVWWLSVLAAGSWTSTVSRSALKNTGSAGTAGAALRHLLPADALCVAAALLSIAVVRRLSGMLRSAVSAAA